MARGGWYQSPGGFATRSLPSVSGMLRLLAANYKPKKKDGFEVSFGTGPGKASRGGRGGLKETDF